LGTLFPTRESLISDIPAGEGKYLYLYLQCVFLYEILSRTPSRQFNRPGAHNVLGMIHHSHLIHDTLQICDQNDRDVSMQGNCVSVTIHFGDQGSLIKNFFGYTLFQHVRSPHPIDAYPGNSLYLFAAHM